MQLVRAQEMAEYLQDSLSDHCEEGYCMIGGSIRREKTEVKDIELICIPRTFSNGLFSEYQERDRDPLFVEWFKAKDMKVGSPETHKWMQFIFQDEIKVDVFTADKDNWGYIQVLRTGSERYNQYVILPGLVRNGYKCRDGYIWANGDIKVPVPDEQTLFSMAGREYVEPYDREVHGRVVS